MALRFKKTSFIEKINATLRNIKKKLKCPKINYLFEKLLKVGQEVVKSRTRRKCVNSIDHCHFDNRLINYKKGDLQRCSKRINNTKMNKLKE